MLSRGPDGHGLWLSADGHAGLAHRRLAIIDLSPAGAQPMIARDGEVAIVFNGEIYNHKALRSELEAQGVVFRSHSDTEVILELYCRDGIAMLPRLRGMFALAIWDADKKGMLLARDPLGIKPLYVSDDGTTLRCASQVKALRRAVDTTADPAGHVGFFLWGHVPEPHTLFRQIRPLPAGSWLWADIAGGRRSGQFFDLRQALEQPPAAPADLRQALLESVAAHLEADVPVGVFLSSGLDSTTLAALSVEAASAPVQSLTLGFQEFSGLAADEVPLAERAASLYRTQHKTVRVSREDFIQNRGRILADMDQPSIDGVNTWFVARAARDLGLKVALSGLGGDELFGGYDAFRQLPRLVNSLRFAHPLRRLGAAARWACAPWIGTLTSPKWAGLLEYGTSYGGAYLLRRSLYMPWELDRVLDPDLVRTGLQDLAPRTELDRMVGGMDRPRLIVSLLESACYMRNQLLRDADWAGMAHSLEIRTPLVDHVLLGQLAALLAANRPADKQSMAACAQPPLPVEIRHRPKTGFFVPVSQWLGHDSLRGWAGHVYSRYAHNEMSGS